MAKNKQTCFLGIEGGGTRSVAVLADSQGKVVARAESGPCNVSLLNDAELRERLQSLTRQLGDAKIARAAVCAAGCRTEQATARVRRVAAQVWKGAEIIAADDLISGLLGGLGKSEGILIISGTGSCVFGMNARGERARVGGWGHFLGDRGSGYEIALRGLRSVIHHYDQTHTLGTLGQRIFARCGFNEPEDAVEWMLAARKSEVAALAGEVFAAKEGGPIIRTAARELADDAALAAKRLGFKRQSNFEVCAQGGVFKNQPQFVAMVQRNLRRKFPRARVILPRGEGALGALQLAMGANRQQISPDRPFAHSPVHALETALTEQRNSRWPNLDRMTVPQLVDAMIENDQGIVVAVRAQRKQIAAAIEIIVHAMKRGGRLFYIGAGTSGRLGVLDASECPPTFGVEPDRVQGIIAGGSTALMSAIEGAEDDASAGVEALRLRGVSKRDVVCGISASGRAPFVLGALEFAQKVGAKTIMLNCNPNFSALRSPSSALISVPTGAEFVTGSTRLKAGTATKLVLNMLTTISMIRLGKVRGNLMTSVRATNVKLRDRAVRIVMTFADCSHVEAQRRLERAGWSVERAIACS